EILSLILNHAEQMQSVEVVRYFFENCLVQKFGLRQLPLLMKRQSRQKSVRNTLRLHGRDGKAGGRLAALMALPHRLVGALDMTAVAVGVEERKALAVSRELRPDRREHACVPRQRERQCLV